MFEFSRTSLFGLLVLSYFYRLIRGRATTFSGEPKDVVVLYLTRNLGDMVFTTPLYPAIKEHYPRAQITVIGQKHNSATLSNDPNIDSYIPYPGSFFSLISVLRSLNADVGIVLVPSPAEAMALFLGRVDLVITPISVREETSSRSLRLMRTLIKHVPFDDRANYAEQNLKLLEPIGIHGSSTKKQLYLSKEAEESIDTFFNAHNVVPGKDTIVALAPGAGTKVKQWPAERFARLAEHIHERTGAPMFIVGGPGDKEEYEMVKRLVSDSVPIVSCLEHSIDELKAFCSRVDIMVANDSAPIYIAEAFDKATLTIVGPTDENAHPPKGEMHRVVTPQWREQPVLSVEGMRSGFDEDKARAQIENVTYESVEGAFDELFALRT
jgi:heptosyltransferase-2